MATPYAGTTGLGYFGGGAGSGGFLPDLDKLVGAQLASNQNDRNNQAALEQLRAQLMGQQQLAGVQGGQRLAEIGAQGDVSKALQSGQLDARMKELLQSQTGNQQLQGQDAAAQMARLQAQLANSRQLQDSDIAGQMQRLTANLGEQRYSTDTNNQTARQGNQLGADTARHGQDLQYGLGQDQLGFQKDKFNTVFGSLSGQLNGGGDTGAAIPNVMSTAPSQVLTPGQIQQQVNAAQATASRTGETQATGANQSLAARGFGSNSGLGFALGQMARGQAAQTGADQERQIRIGAAQDNAQQGTQAAAQNLQAQVSNQDSELRRRGLAAQRQSSLLSALAGLA